MELVAFTIVGYRSERAPRHEISRPFHPIGRLRVPSHAKTHPAVLALNAVAFAFLLLHAITWFNLAPQAMVVHVAGRRVPGWCIAASNYAALAVATAVVYGLLVLEW